MTARLGCICCIALGWIVAAVTVSINWRYGVRMADNDVWEQGAILLALSLGPAAAASVAGAWWNGGNRRSAALMCVLGLVLISFSAWNTSGFMTDQTQGKIRRTERQATAAKDIAEIQNTLTMQERKEMRDNLWRTYTTAKTEKAKSDAMADIQALTGKPVELKAAGIEVATNSERALLLAKWLGWDKETAQGITPSIGPILAAIVEIFFPLLGFAQWPKNEARDWWKDRPPRPLGRSEIPAIERKFTKDEARSDVLRMISAGASFNSNLEAADRWCVSASQASKWLSSFRREGIEFKRVQRGKTKAVVPRVATNGSGNVVAMKPA